MKKSQENTATTTATAAENNNNIMEGTSMETGMMVVNKEDIASVALVDELKNPMCQLFSSVQDDGTRKSKVAIFNAINSADKNIADCIGDTVEIVDVIAHPVQLLDEQTGEVVNALRSILIDKDGVSYVGVSQGVTSALAKIFSIIGSPEGGAWKEEPVKMKFKQVKTRNGNNKVNTIELV